MPSIGIFGGYLVPVGVYNDDSFSFGYEIGILGTYPFNSNFSIGVNLSYNYLKAVLRGSINTIIISPLIRYYFYNNPWLFFQLGAGLYINHADYSFTIQNMELKTNWNRTNLGINIGCGGKFELTKNINLEIAPVFNLNENNGIGSYFLTINAGLNFNL